MGAPQRRAGEWGWWLGLLLLAALLRLPFPLWDGGIAAHPDERFLVGVAELTPLGANLCALAPGFPYGHLPVYLGRLLVALAPGTDPLFALRLLSGLVGVLLVAVAGALGRELHERKEEGWMAAALLAVAPFALQQARFFTVDPFAALFASLAVLWALRGRWAGAGLCAGWAVACKLSAGWVLAPLLFALWQRAPRPKVALVRLLGAGMGAFMLAAPWSLLAPVACWEGPLTQAGMAAGRFLFPYTVQYRRTLPYLYPLVQLGLWGLGPIPTLAGGLGLVGMGARWRRLSGERRVLCVWVLLYFLATAGLFVKFPRYLLPLYPAWAALAAGVLYRLLRSQGLFRLSAGALLLLAVLLPGGAQFGLYGTSHPWEEASRWLYAHVPAGATLAVEAWDHPLPVSLPEGDAAQYTQLLVPLFDPPTPTRAATLAEIRSDADVIILASRRGYGALAREREEQAELLRWYREVLQEREVIAFGRCPRLGPVALADDPLADAGLPVPLPLATRCGAPLALRLPRLDESFRVYDAPLVLLLVK